MSFVRRKLELTFQLGKGAFGTDGFDTVTVADHRVRCRIHEVIGPGMGVASVSIYGLSPTLLNELASLNQATEAVRANRLIIKAGDEGSTLATVFEGQISLSQLDMNSAPDVALNVQAFAGLLQRVSNPEASSYPGGTDAAIILYNLAQKAGLFFENESGASRILATPAYEGSYLEQIDKCVKDAGFERYLGKNYLAIWEKGKSRGGAITLVSAETGMVGYPGYSTSNNGGGIAVRSTFNPQLSVGQRTRVESTLKAANGVWFVFNIAHELDAEVPGGQWFTSFDGYSNG